MNDREPQPARCKNCDAKFRPHGTKKADYPDTLWHCSQGYCYTCYKAVEPAKVYQERPKDCVKCHRPLRARKWKAADHPGTVEHAGKGVCKTCKNAAARAPQEPVEVGPPAVETVQTLSKWETDRRERQQKQDQQRRLRIAQEAARARFIQTRNAA